MSKIHLYRFRPIENLFGEYKELENQSIFFAPPHLLNDPVEGFKDIYWQGDEVLWTNFFNHYLLCLMNSCIDFQIIGDDFNFTENFNACITVEDLHVNFQSEFSIISNKFIGSNYLQNLISGITTHRTKVEEYELKSYLRAIHNYALNCIYERLEEISAVPKNLFKDMDFSVLEIINDQYFTDINKLEVNYGKEKQRQIQELSTFFFDQNNEALVLLSNISEARKNIFTSAFTNLFIEKIEQLMFPEWYTACFMSECTNSSVWGNYGRKHTGVCLIFESSTDDNENKSIFLNDAIYGWDRNGAVRGKLPFRFYPIKYEHNYETINFFDSIAQLPEPSTFKHWFSWDGMISKFANKYTDEWRTQHWSNFYKSVTKKTTDWKYENEYRLLICNMNGSYKTTDTTLRYDFKSLQGIIFGIKTSSEKKIEVIRAIEKKVKENSHYEFKFYQAYYCRNSGQIKHYEMKSLKFKASNTPN